MNDEQLDKIRQYNTQGCSNVEIARQLGVHPTAILYNLKKMDLSSAFCNKYGRKLGDRELIKIRQYSEEGWNNSAIAKQFGVDPGTIRYHLKKMGLLSPLCHKSIEKINDVNARCSKCGEIKDISEFQYQLKGQRYECKISYCNRCRKKQLYSSVNSDIEKFLQYRLTRIKWTCKAKNIPISVDIQYVKSLYKKQKGLCFYTGYKLDWGLGSGYKNKRQLSFDRIVPNLGYIPENVVLCTHQANTVKSNLTLNEMGQWLPSWYKKIKKLSEFKMLKEASKKCN